MTQTPFKIGDKVKFRKFVREERRPRTLWMEGTIEKIHSVICGVEYILCDSMFPRVPGDPYSGILHRVVVGDGCFGQIKTVK